MGVFLFFFSSTSLGPSATCHTMAHLTMRVRPREERCPRLVLPRHHTPLPRHILSCVSLALVVFTKPSEGCVSEGSSSEGVLLLCGTCGHELASERDARFVPSPRALSVRNSTVLGARGRLLPVQRFDLQDHTGQVHTFEVTTFTTADVVKHWPASRAQSWYLGHSWIMATCPRCNTHVGWGYQPSWPDWPRTVTEKEFEESDKTFVALITDRVLREDFTSTLVTPRSYRN